MDTATTKNPRCPDLGGGNGDAEIGCYMVSIVDEPHLFTQGRSTGEFALLCVFWGVSA